MAKTLPKVDIVTVGVGWVGGIIAAELTKKGYKVVGIERGRERSTSDYFFGHDELRYSERYELMTDISKDTVSIRHNMKQRALPMREWGSFLIGDGVGGSANHWSGSVTRFLPYDFEIYSQTVDRYGKAKIPQDMTVQDWGITYEELEKYYQMWEATSGISGEENPHPGLPKFKWPTKPMMMTPIMELFKKAALDLKMHPYISGSANLSEIYTNPDGMTINACQYCGFCERFGCEYGAKSDPTITVVPVAKKTGNYEIRTHSVVRRVLHKDGKATGVSYINTLTGEEFIQPAEVVVLSAWTFGNVKILLNSKLGRPYDPTTGQGVIGKNYTYQSTAGKSTAFFDQQFNLYAGTGALAMAADDFNGDLFDHSELNFIHGGQIKLSAKGDLPIKTNNVPDGTPGWGREFKEKSLEYTNKSIAIGASASCMPNRYNYLDLDPTYRDAYGDPILRMTFNWTDQDRNLVKFLGEKTAAVAKQMGAKEVKQGGKLKDYDSTSYQSTHNVGGAIMGADPETSALNNYLQMWDCENVFVPGANAFPHNSATNPTGTVAALAYRAAEGIEKYLKTGGPLV
ncbi:GMC family oxidoreductase [Brevibacillus fulvus]|uniref:Gluconate 2-dehydrogenase alpha chain n=1 Tax=Brevibacillus fulvus TaxID=1125967 RepID=A0A938XZ17_9BACL|nr:GMC family oxidoreductase [Brevibacillus fulvus]MBM7589514.1 gluconate 2-dehydrogenase alpha chain [Brevibacillus fulvus]